VTDKVYRSSHVLSSSFLLDHSQIMLENKHMEFMKLEWCCHWSKRRKRL